MVATALGEIKIAWSRLYKLFFGCESFFQMTSILPLELYLQDSLDVTVKCTTRHNSAWVVGPNCRGMHPESGFSFAHAWASTCSMFSHSKSKYNIQLERFICNHALCTHCFQPIAIHELHRLNQSNMVVLPQSPPKNVTDGSCCTAQLVYSSPSYSVRSVTENYVLAE